MPPEIRESTSERKVESAPCRVPLPTSSLLKTHSTGMLSPGSAAKKPRRQAKTHCRSSSRGAAMRSPSGPSSVPGVRGYRKSSVERRSASETPHSLPPSPEPAGFGAFGKEGGEVPGRIQATFFIDLPVHVDGHAGDHQQVRSMLTRRLRMASPSRTITRPATDSGRSSQDRQMPPP